MHTQNATNAGAPFSRFGHLPVKNVKMQLTARLTESACDEKKLKQKLKTRKTEAGKMGKMENKRGAFPGKSQNFSNMDQ